MREMKIIVIESLSDFQFAERDTCHLQSPLQRGRDVKAYMAGASHWKSLGQSRWDGVKLFAAQFLQIDDALTLPS